jgi:hypothetical protein
MWHSCCLGLGTFIGMPRGSLISQSSQLAVYLLLLLPFWHGIVPWQVLRMTVTAFSLFLSFISRGQRKVELLDVRLLLLFSGHRYGWILLLF